MIKYYKLSSLWIAAACLLACPSVNQVYAEETSAIENVSSPEEHVPVGERRVSQNELIEMQADRAQRAKNHLGAAQKSEATTEEDSDELIAKKVYYTTHEGGIHHHIAVNTLGDMITLEDGSVWQVKNSDRMKTLDWLYGDSLIILPNHAWFSSYHYVILNQNTGGKVKVNLFLGPIYNGIYTHWIVGIDYCNCELRLEDGSVWKMSSSDSRTVNKWLLNDTVIVGINDSWFSSKPNILINVNMINYAAGECVN